MLEGLTVAQSTQGTKWLRSVASIKPAFVALLLCALSSGFSSAQTDQSASEGGVNVGGNNDGIINTGDCAVNVQDVDGDVHIENCTVYNGDPSSGRALVPALYEQNYREAREELISMGWIPSSIPIMRRRDSTCFYFCETVMAAGFDEVRSCAATGYGQCRFEFHDISGRSLVIITLGEEVDDLWISTAFFSSE